ncbi:MAG: hypothetical protein V4714_12295 [Bacteroidota bacterium]
MMQTISAKNIFHYLTQWIAKTEYLLSKKYSVSSTQSLEKLFSFQFHQIPNNFFLPVDIDGFSESQLQSYHRMPLNPLELGIFDTIEVKMIGASKQVLLRSRENSALKGALVKTLVNELHRLYGKDDTGYALFTSRDEACLEKGAYWSGRLWQHSHSAKQVPLNIYADEEGLALTFMLSNE